MRAQEKAGILSVNEHIAVLEAVRLPSCGTVRCRFADGWVSAHAKNGDVILEKLKEKSAETLSCGQFSPRFGPQLRSCALLM